MTLRNIPEDIKIELLLSYLPEGACKIALKGQHKRNAYYDIIDMEEKPDGCLWVRIGRNSLYNALPEYMFHPIDRFNNLPRLEEKERFSEELDKQEKEISRAYRFFAPMDVLLMLYRIGTREQISPFVETNEVLFNIIGDRLTASQRSNRLIRQTIPFFPYCKTIRGDKTLLTILLRKVLADEGVTVAIHNKDVECRDETPRYADGLDATLNDSYVGNVYDEMVTTYDIHYWAEEKCDEHFLQFVEEMEEFRHFMEDYFLSVEECLCFDISHDGPNLRLSDDRVYNYLNYNTNI